jgi:hypothetical protein
MSILLQADTDLASDTVPAPPQFGAAAADHRVEAPHPSTLLRILVTLTGALAATRRGVGD